MGLYPGNYRNQTLVSDPDVKLQAENATLREENERLREMLKKSFVPAGLIDPFGLKRRSGR